MGHLGRRANVQPVFNLAWTDNRGARRRAGGLSDSTGTPYSPPPITAVGLGETDPTTPRPTACVPAAIGTRDQSVFTARITPAVVLSTASASKPTVFNQWNGNQELLRSYAVIAPYTSTAPNSGKNITFEIVTSPAQPLVKGLVPPS